MVRLFFATDSHGSEQVWRKWLSAATYYKVDILMLSGDITGKAIVPIVGPQSDGTYVATIFGRKHIAHNEEEIRKLEEFIRFSGYYTMVCTPDEVEELKKSPKKVDELFDKVMIENLKRWLNMIPEKVPKDVDVYIMPGNDDKFIIDPVLNECEWITQPAGKVVNLCYDFYMISCEWTNPTPWNTPRECSDKELGKKIWAQYDKYDGDPSKLICNFHCPPYNTRLDLAPKLRGTGASAQPVYVMGKPVMVHVGSKSIRKFMEEVQPMLGLHGHIHESYAYDFIKKTLVVNPGSEYTEGILRAYIIELSKDGIEKYMKIEG
ncbi:MAG: phosphoesterase [Thermoprotei archaeon]|nr:MAG: phosphoesterase [Thermoprotei archaeon]